jgi:hypothetical protein
MRRRSARIHRRQGKRARTVYAAAGELRYKVGTGAWRLAHRLGRSVSA